MKEAVGVRLQRLLGVLICLCSAMTLISASCTNADTEDDDDDDTLSTLDSAIEDDTTTTSPTTTTTTTTETPVETRPTQTIEGAWAQTWKTLINDGPTALTDTGLATPEATEVLGLLQLSGVTTAEHYPRIEIVSGLPQGAGEMAVTDCVMFDTRPPLWLTGNLTRESETEDWVVATVDVIATGGKCVPKEVADAAIAGALAFWDAKPEFWDPIDPDHPLIAETTTGSYQTFLKELLADFGAQGITADFSEERSTFAVTRVDSFDQVLVENCFQPSPGVGFFTPDGEHIEASTPVVEGQTDIEESLMVREADNDTITWKVENLANGANFGCDADNSPRALPVH